MFLPGFCPIKFACPLPDFFTRMTSRTDPSIPVPLACEPACFGAVVGGTAHWETSACQLLPCTGLGEPFMLWGVVDLHLSHT